MFKRVRLAMILFVLGMIGSIVYGQVYSVTVILDGMLKTVAAGVVIVLIYAFLIRWLRVARRRLRFQQLVAQRAQQAQAASVDSTIGAITQSVEEKVADLGEITSETEELVKVSTVALAVVVLLFIWGPLLPALEVFERYSLWTSTSVVDGENVVYEITLSTVITVFILIGLTLFAAKRLPAVVEIILRSRTSISPGARYTTSTLLNYVIVGAGIISGLSALGLQWSELQWLVAALGVGIGFGLQEIVANFISGLIILFERPIRVGDVVTVGDKDGVVTRIRIRATTIKDWDGKELLVPNKEFITGRLLNWTLTDSQNRVVIAIGIAYGSDVEKAIFLLKQVMDSHPDTLQEPKPMVVFENFGDNALELSARCFLANMDRRLAAITELRTEINKVFNQEGIVISFPQRDVHVDFLGPIDVRMNRESAGQQPGPDTAQIPVGQASEGTESEAQSDRDGQAASQVESDSSQL